MTMYYVNLRQNDVIRFEFATHDEQQAQSYCNSCNAFFVAIGSNNRYFVDTKHE